MLERIVDNRTFLLGLDEHYREAMQVFESTIMLPCAAAVGARLGVEQADVPVGGYYDDPELPELATYFRLMRALQDEPEDRAPRDMPEYTRLLEVAGSPLFGRPQYERREEPKMLPMGRDPLTQALHDVPIAEWNVTALTEAARRAAIAADDFSLVGLAARAADSVVLAALRESVILYAEECDVIGDDDAPEYFYHWRVDPELTRCANRFIDIFNGLVVAANAGLPREERIRPQFHHAAFRPIPAAQAEHAEHFYVMSEGSVILGRCANLARDGDSRYHWAVRRRADARYYDDMEVHEFWRNEIWTTSRYRSEMAPLAPLAGRGEIEIV